jgi:hypothetical protein
MNYDLEFLKTLKCEDCDYRYRITYGDSAEPWDIEWYECAKCAHAVKVAPDSVVPRGLLFAWGTAEL